MPLNALNNEKIIKAVFIKLLNKIKYAFEYLLNVDWTSGFIYGRMPFTLKGKKWEMHIADSDPKPSIPHLHAVEDKRFKINIYTGDVFWDGKTAGRLNHKEFQKMWQNEIFLRDVRKARLYYIEHNPKESLPDLPTFVTEDLEEIEIQIEETEFGLRLTSPLRENKGKIKKRYKRRNDDAV